MSHEPPMHPPATGFDESGDQSRDNDPRSTTSRNVDPRETARFAQLADTWWDPNGSSRPLHLLNPVRLRYIEQRCGALRGQRILDVGCGAGLLSEAMCEAGALVTRRAAASS